MLKTKFCMSLFTVIILFAGTKFVQAPSKVVAINKTAVQLNDFKGDKIFDIQTDENLQGAAYLDGHFYIGFDVGKGFGKIRKYDKKGTLVQETDSLAIGHTAELDFRAKNKRLYAANGGGKNPTKIFEIDMSALKPCITKTIDLTSLGQAGLMAIDNHYDTMVVHTADHDKASPTISIVDFNGKMLSHFSIPYQGIPQGLEVHNGIIYFQTNKLVTMLNFHGQVIGQTAVNEPGENEGIAIFNESGKTFYLYSYRMPNRLFKTELHNIQKISKIM